MAAFATRPTQETKDQIDRLRFLKDRMDISTFAIPTQELALRVRNDLRALPTAPVSEGQKPLLKDLDEGIAALDPSWVMGQGGDPVDREHASNKITQLRRIFDRLTAESTKDMDVLAAFSRGSQPESTLAPATTVEEGVTF